MKNITVTLDEETAAWVRVEAARQGLSVSRMLGQLLQQRSRELSQYEQAMQRYLSRKAVAIRSDGAPYPTREETHDRRSVR